ncbi:MAG: hypothetical protein ACRYFW_00475 [Janthinobacterium lividum]
MRIIALTLSALPVAATTVSPLAGWTGEWHLDRAASHFRGEVTRITRTPQGYRFDLGAVSFILPDDGAFHSTIAGRETRLAKLDGGRWEREHRIHGRIVDRSVLSVSADARILTIAGEHPGAAPEQLVREGAGTGLAGTWRSTRLGINAADILAIAALSGGRLRWGSLADGNWYVATLGGAPAVNQGPTATPIATFQVTVARDGTLRWTERLNGKPFRLGIERRSADGETLTETAWPANMPAERQALVYRHPS